METKIRTNFIAISNSLTENQKLSVVNLLLLISRIERESENNITENEEAYIGALLLNFNIRLWDIKLGNGELVFKGCGEYMNKYGVDKLFDDLKCLSTKHKELLSGLVIEFSKCDSIPAEAKLLFIAHAYHNIGIQTRKPQESEKFESEKYRTILYSADVGNADAQYILGTWFMEGQEVGQDTKKAIEWLQRSAEQGHARAQYNLGAIYYDEEDNYFDSALAFKWYYKSAIQGFVDAQLGLATLYFEGDGVLQNLQEAVNWFQKAAAQGDSTAQFLLGKLYAEGYGVPKNYTIAAKYFQQAADQGDQEAYENLELLKLIM
jgi:hypothetical protein